MKRLISLMLAAVLLFAFSGTAVSLSKMGSVGDEVADIQTVLQKQGYYQGNIDGIFGTATRNAVLQFQRDNGLTADGIAGKNTLTAMGLNADSGSYGGFSSSDYVLLARVISAEARGEPYLGQVAVGAVILNRIEHPSFPDTLSGVIYQRGAFTCIDDGQFYEDIADTAYTAARDALNGLDPSGGAIYYYNPKTATSKWIYSRPVITTIGDHVFCS